MEEQWGNEFLFPTIVILHGYMHSKSQSGLLHVSRVKAACGQLENYFIFQLTAVLPDVQLPSEWRAQMAVLLLHRLRILSLVRQRKAGAVLYCAEISRGVKDSPAVLLLDNDLLKIDKIEFAVHSPPMEVKK